MELDVNVQIEKNMKFKLTGDLPEYPVFAKGIRRAPKPMVLPVNRVQSPISTARANAVSVPMPRRQPRRRTSAVNSQSVAAASMAVSRRSRRDLTVKTVS